MKQVRTPPPDGMHFCYAAVDGKVHARTVGGDRFGIEIAGPFREGAAPAVIRDNSNGTYEVTWSTDTAGDYLVTAKLDGFAVGGCPVCCRGDPLLAVASGARHCKQCGHLQRRLG